MSALLHALHLFYDDFNHTESWNQHSDGSAEDNPLVYNRYIQLLRRAHHVQFTKYVSLSIKTRSLTVDTVCSHTAKC